MARTRYREWHQALDAYNSTIEQQGDERLSNLDRWYHGELRTTLLGRAEPHILHEELEGIAGWKMRRGVWRERNRRLVGGNPPELVIELSRNAFAEVPDLRKPITTISKLAGVGPATASAVLVAYAPEVYPFFDEVVAGQIPSLDEVEFTTKYYIAYAEAMRGGQQSLQLLAHTNRGLRTKSIRPYGRWECSIPQPKIETDDPAY